MASKKKDDEKTVDLPPHGDRNPDPITDSPGSHPIETGVGAALGGAASGVAMGAALGPVGAVAGAIIGAVAGGLAGKGVGEVIDPTTEDNWLRESFTEKEYVGKGEKYEHYEPVYRYAGEANARFEGKKFEDVETHIRSDYEKTPHASGMAWDRARDAVRDAYDRTLKLREEKLNVGKTSVEKGQVGVRKEVITEHKTITVPVEREEVVIERKAVNKPGGTADLKAEEIRIPVREEEVHVSKESVIKEEVTVGKRKVTEQRTVGADVSHEELIVDKDTDAKVRETKKPKKS